MLLVILVAVFLAQFDANQYKQDLAQQVNEQTGRKLEFIGDVNLSFYPLFGLNLGAIEFSNAAGFSQQPMLKINKLSIEIDVLSLLKQQPKIKQLVLDGLEVNLAKNKQGMSNWDDLIVSETEQQPSTEPSQKQSPESDDIGKVQFLFDGLKISNAKLFWNDESTGQKIAVKSLNLTTGSIAFDKTFPLKLQVSVQQNNDINAELDLNTLVTYKPKSQQALLQIKQLKLNASGELIPFKQSEIIIKGDVDFSAKTNTLSLKAFQIEGHMSEGLLEQIDLKLSTELGMDLNTQELSLAALDLQTNLKGELIPKSKMNLGLSSSQIDLKLAENFVNIDGLKLQFNQQSIEGNIKVNDYLQPDVEFNLSSKRIDLDELLGLNEPTEEVIETGEEAESTEDLKIELPTELLNALKIKGQLTIDEFKASNLKTQKITLGINAESGVIKLNPFNIDLYQGQITNKITLNATQAKPKYSLDTQLKQVQIEGLVKDMVDIDKIAGATNASIQVTTQGEYLSKLKKNSNGIISLLFKDGLIKDFDLNYLVKEAEAKLKKKNPPENKHKDTKFAELSVSGKITNGVFSSNDLNLVSPILRVGGEGKVDLNDNSLDYRVEADIASSSKDNESKFLIPVKLSGPFSDIKINVLLDDLLKQQAKQKLAAEKAKLKAKLGAEKQKLKADLEAKKQKLAAQKKAEEAKLKAEFDVKKKAEAAKLEAKKQKAIAELEAKKAAEKAKLEEEKAKLAAKQKEKEAALKKKAKQKAKEKLKKLF